jgi:hypothetical protein
VSYAEQFPLRKSATALTQRPQVRYSYLFSVFLFRRERNQMLFVLPSQLLKSRFLQDRSVVCSERDTRYSIIHIVWCFPPSSTSLSLASFNPLAACCRPCDLGASIGVGGSTTSVLLLIHQMVEPWRNQTTRAMRPRRPMVYFQNQSKVVQSHFVSRSVEVICHIKLVIPSSVILKPQKGTHRCYLGSWWAFGNREINTNFLSNDN